MAIPPKPANIPITPTERNRPRLKEWVLELFGFSTCDICPYQLLQTMKAIPLNITFIPGTIPTAVHTSILVPYHWKRRVKQNINWDDTPTTWCHRMVVVPKKNGSHRCTVDLQKLNAATKRETHHTSSPFNQASMMPAHTRKTVLYTWNGYHSLPPLSSYI